MDKKEYGKGTCFKSINFATGHLRWDYYMIVKGSFTEPYYNTFIEPKRIYVQKLKWNLEKTELIPVNDFENKEYIYQYQYRLINDETIKPQLFKDDIILSYIFDIEKAIKKVEFKDWDDRPEKKNITTTVVELA